MKTGHMKPEESEHIQWAFADLFADLNTAAEGARGTGEERGLKSPRRFIGRWTRTAGRRGDVKALTVCKLDISPGDTAAFFVY